jgi:hypothetical protein
MLILLNEIFRKSYPIRADIRTDRTWFFMTHSKLTGTCYLQVFTFICKVPLPARYLYLQGTFTCKYLSQFALPDEGPSPLSEYFIYLLSYHRCLFTYHLILFKTQILNFEVNRLDTVLNGEVPWSKRRIEWKWPILMFGVPNRDVCPPGRGVRNGRFRSTSEFKFQYWIMNLFLKSEWTVVKKLPSK